MDTPDIPVVLDYLGVFVFAATGALAAARKQQDFITFVAFATMTGVGGGSLRDMLIGAPIFWLRDPGFFAACLVTAAAVWLAGPRPRLQGTLLWLDAVGLAGYGIVGAAKASLWGLHPIVCLFMGTLTATCGGLIRDLLAGEPSVLLRREITITAALTAAGVYLALVAAGAGAWVSAGLGFAAGFALRAGALLWGWSLQAPRKG